MAEKGIKMRGLFLSSLILLSAGFLNAEHLAESEEISPVPSSNRPRESSAKDAVTSIQESDLGLCQRNSDCIVVPYKHCCGSTKRAIHKKHLALYQRKPEWQVFDGAACALMGQCPPDSEVKTASCKGDSIKRCELDMF